MNLYDDIDTKPRSSQIDGWSSGIKMLQTQLAIKKAVKKPLMTPVVNLRAKRSTELETISFAQVSATTTKPIITGKALEPVLENMKDDWDFLDEYDPQWPNEYEKLKEKAKGIEKSRASVAGTTGGFNREERGKECDRERKRGRTGRREIHNVDISPPTIKLIGFGQRQNDDEMVSPPPIGSETKQGGGAAIAPPLSLQEISIESADGSSNVTIPYSASSVAAKIMAKYGFKDGQGLGKSEQGMSIALQVEKTSKRGGRIIHEKDVVTQQPTLPPTFIGSPTSLTPNHVMPPPQIPSTLVASGDSEPTITEIMKSPSKVVLLRNMVGPGDVDVDLEPEVKDECNTKYGEVNSVIIHEAFGTVPEDAVKIFVEFRRIESAIKAVVDLNGRFFGGRQVRAMFYNYDKFKNFNLN
ncbi:splicing factor 45 [Drosophila ficusphila]|uniref:splicing factor 45 n=1 Tax=Drosophila ficusphila TaxID=30025 RepID=UPI0007E87B56|nr:splicing factor 45 [Drosophila ficusphila]